MPKKGLEIVGGYRPYTPRQIEKRVRLWKEMEVRAEADNAELDEVGEEILLGVGRRRPKSATKLA